MKFRDIPDYMHFGTHQTKFWSKLVKHGHKAMLVTVAWLLSNGRYWFCVWSSSVCMLFVWYYKASSSDCSCQAITIVYCIWKGTHSLKLVKWLTARVCTTKTLIVWLVLRTRNDQHRWLWPILDNIALMLFDQHFVLSILEHPRFFLKMWWGSQEV